MYLQEKKSMGKPTWPVVRKMQMAFKAYVFSITWMVGSLIVSIPSIPLLLTGQRHRSRVFAHTMSGYLARFLHWLCYQPLTIEGKENLLPPDVPVVYVANHSSTGDIAVFYHIYRNFAWVSKASVFTVPGIGMLMWLSGYVSLSRGSKESGKRMLRDCRRDCLDKKFSVAIFPQGTRRRHKILDFKHGAFTLAIEAQVPIVPVTIELPEDAYWFGSKGRPRMIIHKPIQPSDPLFKDKEKLATFCFDTVINALSYGPAMLRAQNAAGAAVGGGFSSKSRSRSPERGSSPTKTE